MSIRKILASSVTILLAVLLFKCVNDLDIAPDTYVKNYSVILNQDTLNVKLVIWGISGNHYEVTLSSNKKVISEFDKIEDYVFEGSLPVVFGLENDTLYTFSSKLPRIPTDFPNKENIINKKVTNEEMQVLVSGGKGYLVVDYPHSE